MPEPRSGKAEPLGVLFLNTRETKLLARSAWALSVTLTNLLDKI